MSSRHATVTNRFARGPARQRAIRIAVACSMLVIGACSDDTPADLAQIGTVEVSPKVTTARVGTTLQLSAVVKDPAGVVMPSETVTWSASEPRIATVTPAGLVTFVAPGATAIVANARGYTGFASVVSDANVATIRLSTAATANLPQGQTVQVVATPLDPAGNALSRAVTWTSSTPTAATVSATGLVTSVAAGNTTVTATSEGKTASTTFTIVPPPPVATVAVSTTGNFLPTLINVPLTAIVRDANNGLLTDRLVTWTTSDSPIATISSTGVLSPKDVGSVTVTATSEGKSGSATFNVLTGLKSGTGVVFSNALGSTAGTFAATTQFAVYVPVGTTSLLVTLRNGTGDPDLYLYRPGNTNLFADNCNSGVSGPTENCTVTNPAAGVWWVVVDSYVAHAGTTITATITPTPP